MDGQLTMRLKISLLPALCLLAIAALAPTFALASGAASASRISAEVDSSQLARLTGSLLPMAQPRYDTGRLAPSTKLEGISIYFSRSAAQEADLQALLAAQQNPASPQYHQGLTPDQFAVRFGISDADLAKAQAWLQQQGFQIDSIARSRNMIRFTGTVAQVEQAFATQMHTYSVPFKDIREKHFAPSTELSIPAALAPVVLGVRNLDDFRPHSMRTTSHVSTAKPQFTSGISGSNFIAPGDIDVIYDINSLHSAGYTGAGQTIDIMGRSSIVPADIAAFQSAAGLTVKAPIISIVPNSGSATLFSGDESESDLDLEWSGAIATGATLNFIYTGNAQNYGVFDSLQYAVDSKIGNIISISYGSCEYDLGQTNINTIEAIASQAASQGQSIFAASGDQGSTTCYGSTNDTKAQQEQLNVSYPASSAYVTGVGGTEFNEGSGTYWDTTSGSNDILTSAKSYIPEVVWNDDSSQYGLSASGGGVSTFVPRPSWQAGVTGIPSGTYRLVPDISLDASNDHEPYLFCSSDTSAWSTGQQASCNSGFRDSSSTDLTVAGGTSFATPIFAGIVALINQKANEVSGQGLINPTLYTLAANSSTYGSAFHDITSGNNDCTAGSTYCSGSIGYSATTGYDQTTGLGTVDADMLANAWPAGSSTLIGTTTTITPSNTAPSTGTNVTYTIGVSSNTGSTTPTGTVDISVNGTAATTVTLTNGAATYQASYSTAGAYSIVASYQGDTTHAASTGTTSINVGGVSSGKGTFTITAPTLTVTDGTLGTSTITVTPAGGYTGTILFSLSTTSSNLTYVCPVISNLTVSGTAPVTTTLGMDTNGANCYATGQVRKSIKHLSASNAPGSSPRGPIAAGTALAGLLLFGLLGRKSARLRSLAAVILIASAGIAFSGCGGGSSSSGGGTTIPNPPTGSYTITLTGTDSTTSTITYSTNFTLTID